MNIGDIKDYISRIEQETNPEVQEMEELQELLQKHKGSRDKSIDDKIADLQADRDQRLQKVYDVLEQQFPADSSATASEQVAEIGKSNASLDSILPAVQSSELAGVQFPLPQIQYGTVQSLRLQFGTEDKGNLPEQVRVHVDAINGVTRGMYDPMELTEAEVAALATSLVAFDEGPIHERCELYANYVIQYLDDFKSMKPRDQDMIKRFRDRFNGPEPVENMRVIRETEERLAGVALKSMSDKFLINGQFRKKHVRVGRIPSKDDNYSRMLFVEDFLINQAHPERDKVQSEAMYQNCCEFLEHYKDLSKGKGTGFAKEIGVAYQVEKFRTLKLFYEQNGKLTIKQRQFGFGLLSEYVAKVQMHTGQQSLPSLETPDQKQIKE